MHYNKYIDEIQEVLNMMTVIGYGNLGMYCDVYDTDGRKLVRVFRHGYYETEEELRARVVKEIYGS